ncbi:MAG TPA: AarF/ABC1/UbiB kinase family protein [Kofleriaceae bacterium]|nr:AarF/ABC1/UbiB kinase family protein [Kofleriaceae bacterium]
MPDDLDELTGGLRRMWSTASLSSKLGMKAASRVLFRKKAQGEDVEVEASLASTEAAIAAARKLVTKMGNLKGLAMKAGQIASYMPGSLPPAAQQVLAELQAQSTPMAFHRIDEVLRAELGAPAAELFETIDERPFAAASIGQVHRATHRGQAVAVKVQYPGIDDAIRSDLKMVAVIARLSAIGSPLDGAGLANELRDRLLEECDYEREAANQALFARLLGSIEGAHVPAVVADRSTRRVLTTVLADGVPLADSDPAIRDRAGQVIFRTCFELLFRRCIYNADPHPGNYLIAADGSVTFLDFGCVRRFEPSMIAIWRRMALSIIEGDRERWATEFRALGFVGKEKGFDWDYQWNAMRFLYRPFLERGFRFDRAFVAKSFGVLMFDNPNRLRLDMPPAWLFLNRLQWGLNAVLAQLGASGDWGGILHDALTRPIEPA